MLLEVNGQKVEVDDGFEKLTPDQQNTAVDEIAASLGPAPAPDEKPKNEAFNYSFLPIHVAEDGGISPGVPAAIPAMIDSAAALFTAPARALTNQIPMTNLDGSTSDRAIEEAFNMASWIVPGSPAMLARTTAAEKAATNFAAANKAANREGNQVNLAANRIGVDMPKSYTTDSKIMQATGKSLENQPIIGSPLLKATENATAQLDDAVKGVRADLGTGSIHNAGNEVKEATTKYAKNFLVKQENKRYEPMEKMITQNVITPLKKTGETMLEIMARRDNATLPDGPAVRMVRKAVFKQHGDKITDLSVPVKPGDTVESVFHLSTGLNYQGIKDLRSYVRETLDDPERLAKAGMSEKDLSRIYKTLTEDLKSAVERGGGPKALAEWEKVNAYSYRASKEREALQKIIGTKEPEAIVDTILAAAGTNSRASLNKLFQARKAVDKETWDELSSAAIERMGRDADGNFSPDRWLTARGKLSETGKKMLFNTTGKKDLGKHLDDIDAVSRRLAEINRKFGNSSGTARNLGAVEIGKAVVTYPIKLVASVAGGRLMSKYLAEPETAKTVADYMKAFELKQRAPGLSSNEAFTKKASVLARLIANDMGNPALSEGITAKLILGEKAAATDETDGNGGRDEAYREPAQASQQFNDAYLQGRAF